MNCIIKAFCISIFLIATGLLHFPSIARSSFNCQAIFSKIDPEVFKLSEDDLGNCRQKINDQAAEGDVPALILKSQISLRGIGEKVSRRNARISLEAAEAKGSALAKRLLADILITKLGADEEDYLEAETLFLNAARLGDSKAATKLGQLYVSGKVPGKSASDVQAIFETTGGNDDYALLSRAKLLLSRSDASAKLAQIIDLLQQASNLGNTEASFLFAMLNLNNEGYSSIGKPELSSLLCRSADEGHAPAMYECAKRRFTIGETGKAVEMLELAANTGHAESIEFLAEHMSKTNFDRAKKLWFRAATLGSDVAKLALIYRFDSLTRDEQLNVNGAFAYPAAFTTDLGRIMLGNHYLAIVEKGRKGTYIKGEHWYYENALQAFSMVANSQNKDLADKARLIANELRSQQDAYEKGLQTRRFQRRVEFWAGVAAITYKILQLSGNNSQNSDLQMQDYENRQRDLSMKVATLADTFYSVYQPKEHFRWIVKHSVT